jgi:hypothetical protein|tara:strand:+ start:960 stop:1727 length:768 start_codon:yes stop_codon:yes gene_type:complete
MKNINIFLLFYFIINWSTAEVINKKDLNLFNQEDKTLFLKKCYANKKYSNSLNCINFLGIKIFIKAYQDKTITNEKFDEITSIAIKYLKYSANNGNKASYINLGWIYSVNKSSFFSLNKSAEYFNKANVKVIKVIKKNTIKARIKKNTSTNLNYSYIKLSTALIEKLDIYFSYSEPGKGYISEKEIKEAKKIYNEIIMKSNINHKTLKKIQKKVTNDNEIILGFLKNDLKIYSRKYKDEASVILEQLKSIYNKLN